MFSFGTDQEDLRDVFWLPRHLCPLLDKSRQISSLQRRLLGDVSWVCSDLEQEQEVIRRFDEARHVQSSMVFFLRVCLVHELHPLGIHLTIFPIGLQERASIQAQLRPFTAFNVMSVLQRLVEPNTWRRPSSDDRTKTRQRSGAEANGSNVE